LTTGVLPTAFVAVNAEKPRQKNYLIFSLFIEAKILYHTRKRAEIVPLFGAPHVVKKEG